jgi:hypothetical protein
MSIGGKGCAHVIASTCWVAVLQGHGGDGASGAGDPDSGTGGSTSSPAATLKVIPDGAPSAQIPATIRQHRIPRSPWAMARSSRRAAQTLALTLLLAACGGDGSGPSGTYTLGGDVSGLASGATLTLSDTSTQISISANGAFTIARGLASGSNYSISVTQQPSAPVQHCAVANGSGAISSSNVANVTVTCVTSTFDITPTVTGLTGVGLVLTDNGTDALTVAANGIVSFKTAVPSGASYNVAVKAQPSNPTQVCTVSGGSGTVKASNVTGVSVNCDTSITVDNADTITVLSGRTAESVLQLSSFAGELLTYLSAHPAAQVVQQCTDPSATKHGTATYAFSDNDKSGTVSAGDSVTVTLVSCYSPSMSDYPSGTVKLTLGSPPAGSYVLAFTAQVSVTPLSLVDRTITGTLTSTYTDTETARVVSAAVANAGLTIVGNPGGFFQQDTVTVHSAAVSKSAAYVTPQYQDDLTVDLSSVAQKGRFQVSTPTAITGPFMSYSGIYPTAGSFEVSSGATAVRLTALSVASNDVPAAALNDGSGTFAPLPGDSPWNGPFSGFTWWEPHSGAVMPTEQPGYAYANFGSWGMSLLYIVPWQDPINGIIGTDLPVTAPIKMFFSAPLDTTRTQFIFEPQYYSALPNVTPSVTSNGAITTLTASFMHGFTYQIPAVDLYSTENVGTSLLNYQTLSTSNNLVADAAPHPAVASPGQLVTLSSSRSLSTNSTITGYAWQQLSGTSVQLMDAASATASFTVPALAVNGEALVFQLTITDHNGETDSVPVTAFVLTDLTQPFLYFRQQQSPAAGQLPEMATLESPVSGTVTTQLSPSTFSWGYSSGSMGDSLQLNAPAAGNLGLGSFQSSASLIVNDARIGFNCNAPDQSFTVLALSAGSGGTVDQFAADFSESCPGGYSPFVGSVRVNSLAPLP